jgi:hypothetical protein
METKTQILTQPEVTIRTLNSDIKSIEHGATSPIPEIVKINSIPAETLTANPIQKKKQTKTIVFTIIFFAIILIGYFYLYPKVRLAFTGQVI